MKKVITTAFLITFVALLTINVYAFVNDIKLGNDIGFYESEIKKLTVANSNLENDLFAKDSLQYAASVAAQINFTQESQPISLGQQKFAKR